MVVLAVHPGLTVVLQNERYQDADRLKVVGMYLKPIDYKLESRNLLTAISAFA